MKKARDDKPIQTIPKGAYEAGVINPALRKSKHDINDITTDLQGNGYPVSPSKNKMQK